MSVKEDKARAERIIGSTEVHYVHERDIHLTNNELYLMGVDRGYEVALEGAEPGVDNVMANRFTKNVNLAMLTHPRKPILTHMSTCGGDWNFGMQIHNTIKAASQAGSLVTIVNYTHARSMSSLILQAADWRVMMPDSHFMFHDGSYADWGTMKEVGSNFDFYREVGGRTMSRIYAEQMQKKGEFAGKNLEDIEAWLRERMDKKENVYLTAEEAVALGFADEIFQGWDHYRDGRTRMPRIPKNLAKERRTEKKQVNKKPGKMMGSKSRR